MIAPKVSYRRVTPISIEHRANHPRKAWKGTRKFGRALYQVYLPANAAPTAEDAVIKMAELWDGDFDLWWKKV